MRCYRCCTEDNLVSLLPIENNRIDEIFVCENCLHLISNQLTKISQAIFPLIIAYEFKSEANEIFDQTCNFCHKNFLDFLFSSGKGCAACQHCFRHLYDSLINLLNQKAFNGQKDENINLNPFFHKELTTRYLNELKLEVSFLKERLEALIRDERYELAKEVNEKLNGLKKQIIVSEKNATKGGVPCTLKIL